MKQGRITGQDGSRTRWSRSHFALTTFCPTSHDSAHHRRVLLLGMSYSCRRCYNTISVGNKFLTWRDTKSHPRTTRVCITQKLYQARNDIANAVRSTQTTEIQSYSTLPSITFTELPLNSIVSTPSKAPLRVTTTPISLRLPISTPCVIS